MKFTRKVKIRRKKINVARALILLLSLYLIGYIIYKTIGVNINNIYIYGNEIVKDQTIIEDAKISNYPPFYTTTSFKIKKNILKNPYIKNVEIKKKLYNSVHIYIEEYNLLFINKDKLVREDGKEIDNKYNITNLPILINDVKENKYPSLLKQMKKVDKEIKEKMSEIKYVPNQVDKERFLVTMNDGNYVYLTLTKFKEINDYLKIVIKLEGHKGILYLDSGNYFEKTN